MNNSAFRAVYYRDSMSKVTKLINELGQVGNIVSVENVVVKFADGRVTRIVYSRSFLDRVLGGDR